MLLYAIGCELDSQRPLPQVLMAFNHDVYP